MDEDTTRALAVVRLINVRRSESEDGLTSSRRLTRHFVEQMETFHLSSVVRLRMPRKKEAVFLRRQLGDSLLEVPVLSEEKVWCTDKATKRAIYNSKNFIPVGGRAGKESEDEEVNERRMPLCGGP